MKKVLVLDKVKLEDLPEVALRVKQELKTPAILFLEGNLGAGKTTFAKVFMGSEEGSPTYTLLNDCGEALHGDFYRLEDPDEIEFLELGAYLEGKKYFLLEWGMKWLPLVKRLLPDEMSGYHLSIQAPTSGEETREFVLSAMSDFE